MSNALISYDKDLPSIEGRLPWEEPTSHLVKDETAPTGWREQQGRRDSSMLLVPKIRSEVKNWRESGYPGASEVTHPSLRVLVPGRPCGLGLSNAFSILLLPA